MSLSVDIRHRLGTLQIDARFEMGSGLVALFGRSGSGKTSIINIIAGLIRPDEGRIVVDGETLVDTARRIYVPRHRRRIGYVFQEGRLFPHMTVRQNLLYGRWFAPREARRDELDKVVEMLGIEGLLERRPGRLSGGEKQRVAIGRALLAAPRLLLMDEPLASLDEARKGEIMPYIERLRDRSGIPIVYVSHSVDEVMRLASTAVLLADGKVVAAGATEEVFHRLDLASQTGRGEASTLVEATVAGQDQAYGLTRLRSRAGDWTLPHVEAKVGSRVLLRVRAGDVTLARSKPQDVSALNVIEGVIAEIGNPNGPALEVRLDCNGDMLIAGITRYSLDRLALTEGMQVYALVKSVALDRRSIGDPSERSDVAVERPG
jgi:molybdate transport system ATP-binding protein